MRTSRIVPVLAAAAIVLAACSSGGSTPTEPTGATPVADSATTSPAVTMDVLANRTYTSTKVTENGADRPLASPTPISLAFTADALSANAGCNTITGGATVTDGVLVAGPLASTMMACEQALMDQDTWLSAFLADKPTVTVDGDALALATATTTIDLTFVDSVGAYDTPVFTDDELPRVEALCTQLVADKATEQQAQAAAEDKGYRFRVLARDGEQFPATADHVPGRVNVEVTGDVVTVCTAG